MSRDPDEDGFLSRWSRRKRAGEEQDPPGEPSVQAAATPEDAPSDEEALSDEEILAKYNLPDPDTLQPGDDYSAFLRAPIPRHLQQVALRKLWLSNPVFGVLDGLNEYDGDYTGGGVAPGVLKTAYKVGRGFLSDQPEEEEAEAETTAPEPTEPLALEDAAKPVSKEITSVSEEEHMSEDVEPDGIDEEDAVPEGATKRRMAFRFSDTD